MIDWRVHDFARECATGRRLERRQHAPTLMFVDRLRRALCQRSDGALVDDAQQRKLSFRK